MLQEGLVKELMQRDTERNKEWKRFFEVEKQWQNIMMHLKSSNTWLQLSSTPCCWESCLQKINMTSHMKLPLPTRNFPKSTDTTPRSLRSPGGQSPCEAYFNGGMGLSPMSAYFEGPQVFFGGNAGKAVPSEVRKSSHHPPTFARC
eukprot:symbB.v1.2.007695.t1/scaffold468.1/size202162/9